MKKILLVVLLGVLTGGCMYPMYVRMGGSGEVPVKYYVDGSGNRYIVMGAVSNLTEVSDLTYRGRVVINELVVGGGVVTNLDVVDIDIGNGTIGNLNVKDVVAGNVVMTNVNIKNFVAGGGVITNLDVPASGTIDVANGGMIRLLGGDARIFSTGTNHYLSGCGIGTLNASRAYALYATNVYLYIRGPIQYNDKLGLIQYTGGTNLYFSEIIGTNYVPYRINLIPVP